MDEITQTVEQYSVIEAMPPQQQQHEMFDLVLWRLQAEEMKEQF